MKARVHLYADTYRELREILYVPPERFYAPLGPHHGLHGFDHHAGVGYGPRTEPLPEKLRSDLSQRGHVPGAHLVTKTETGGGVL